MFRLIKQVFIELLSVSLSNEPCMDRPTLFDLNPVKLNYYAF